jgi:hypothetical protein
MSKESLLRFVDGISKNFPHETVAYPEGHCLYNKGHTYAPCEMGGTYQAYTVTTHTCEGDATDFASRPVYEWDGTYANRWQRISWEQLIYEVFDLEEPVEEFVKDEWEKRPVASNAYWKLLEPRYFDWFCELKPLLQRIYLLSYLGNGTWEQSHLCFIYKLAEECYYRIRMDISGVELSVESVSPFEDES